MELTLTSRVFGLSQLPTRDSLPENDGGWTGDFLLDCWAIPIRQEKVAWERDAQQLQQHSEGGCQYISVAGGVGWRTLAPLPLWDVHQSLRSKSRRPVRVLFLPASWIPQISTAFRALISQTVRQIKNKTLQQNPFQSNPDVSIRVLIQRIKVPSERIWKQDWVLGGDIK